MNNHKFFYNLTFVAIHIGGIYFHVRWENNKKFYYFSSYEVKEKEGSINHNGKVSPQSVPWWCMVHLLISNSYLCINLLTFNNMSWKLYISSSCGRFIITYLPQTQVVILNQSTLHHTIDRVRIWCKWKLMVVFISLIRGIFGSFSFGLTIF